MPKILIIGSTGFIGSQFKEAFLAKNYSVADPRIEITNLSALRKAMDENKPDLVLNAAGITGTPNVDWCETHPAETISVNVAGALNIAAAAHERGIYMVHLGSGCVYDGDNGGKGYSENDEPNYFGSLYSRSKLYSEKLLKEFPNILQLRIRIPIMGRPNPKNLIDKLQKYPKMINVPNSCTVMEDFFPVSIQLIEKKATGIFNMTNISAMDHQSIMEVYREIVDPEFKINLMPDAEQKELCKRRSNCVLNTDKRERLGAHMPPLEESVLEILKEYKQSISRPKL